MKISAFQGYRSNSVSVRNKLKDLDLTFDGLSAECIALQNVSKLRIIHLELFFFFLVDWINSGKRSDKFQGS